MIGITDVFKAINKEIRTIFPNAKIYKERINKLTTPSLSVELISYRTPQHSKNIINKKIDLDIIYFSEKGKVIEALNACEKLMSAFSMGIFVRNENEQGIVDKRFIHCLKTPEHKLVDDDLHFLVTFEYADELKATYLADDGNRYEFGEDSRGSVSDGVNDSNTKKEFVEDIKFKDEKDKKKYYEEELKMMEHLKLEYTI